MDNLQAQWHLLITEELFKRFGSRRLPSGFSLSKYQDYSEALVEAIALKLKVG